MLTQILKNFNSFDFQHDLLDWYYENKRDLPWRQSQDPYKVWVSEIMLQQTKVDTVIPYFYRFLEKFPTLYDLAEAEEQEVLKVWEGLGYYSRARNLQAAVKEVVESYDAKVPDTKEELGKLKGVGPYTRGAILSIAYNQPEPAVDGNVMRVFSRVLKLEDDISQAKTKKKMESIIREIISEKDPSSFNQAIMDLGATICTPKSPACLLCPVQEYCRAFADGVEEKLPIKKKTKKQKVIPYIVLQIKNKAGSYIIEKRPDSGLLANLWQFPMIHMKEVGLDGVVDYMRKEYGISIRVKDKQGSLNHVFSHLKWDLDIFEAETDVTELKDERLKLVSKEEIEEFPFPVSHQKMINFLE
ncbi:A/G-specific adenine glycosylase [Oceanobacillus senegalensis]|uniref:A/G-specific adenine glycosylase n=1 Tax=Oceanobacillus senegalensis TaxID=1936063 RepID=UPI000A311654|nr:A/G-specific adenine glycosylase [Oceanobacillus senegalensis]